MKALLLIFSLLLAFPVLASDTPESEIVLEELLNEGVDFEEGKFYTEIDGDKTVTCYAFTQCPVGGHVYCYAYGQGCFTRVVYGRKVSCTGFSFSGGWHTTTIRCPRYRY